jgi:hypothetical protein
MLYPQVLKQGPRVVLCRVAPFPKEPDIAAAEPRASQCPKDAIAAMGLAMPQQPEVL